MLKAPAPEPVQSPPPQQQEEAPKQAPSPPPAQDPQPAQVGESIQAHKRDPMSMIKHAAPVLSAGKRESTPRPLGPLTAAASADETCVWNRVRSIHDQSFCNFVSVHYPGFKQEKLQSEAIFHHELSCRWMILPHRTSVSRSAVLCPRDATLQLVRKARRFPTPMGCWWVTCTLCESWCMQLDFHVSE